MFCFKDDEIRQNEGFKNVSLGNVIPAAYKESVIPFLNDADKQLLEKHRVAAFEVSTIPSTFIFLSLSCAIMFKKVVR